MHLKILSFNWHEPYLCNLAKLGHQFSIVAPQTGPGVFRKWDTKMRTIPSNVTIISPEQAEEQLQEGAFDLAIANNVKDLIWLNDYDLPKINVFHCRLSTEIALSNADIEKTDYLERLEPLLKNVTHVFISDSKKKDWGLGGDVIIHGIDLDEYGGYTGENPVALRVGNLIREMDLARGYTQSEEILKGHPSVTLGMNPLIAGARISQGFQDLIDHYRESRLYINTTIEAYEDGYNLSLLEAMATGMPVVSLSNNTSPIVDGLNGYVSDDLAKLNARVGELLNDPKKALELGRQARETIRREFPLDAFLEKWSNVIKKTLQKFLEDRGVNPSRQETPLHQRERKNILMDYVSHPATTAYYLERAFRESHNVVTTGATINQEVIQKWDLSALNWPIKDQDIFRGSDGTLAEVLKQLPAGWNPDFYLYVETGLSGIPNDLDKIELPKVCYLIDTHLHLERHIEIGKQFDHVFIAQKEYLPEFKDAGIPNAYWLPLGCDPEIHGKQNVEKEFDVGFVGSINANHPRRQKLLESIQQKFDLFVDRKFMNEMTEVFSKSRIVFNNAIKNDLNMRVFEALCSGSLLVTDQAYGLQEFFEHGEHLAIYEDDHLLDTIAHYLEYPEERERIAEKGREEVLARHTYGHRAQQMIETLNNHWAQSPVQPATKQNESPVGMEEEGYYTHVRHDLIPLIPQDARSILEVGCGGGRTGAYLKENLGAVVVGLEINPEAASEAREILDHVVEGNLETMEPPFAPASFDCILFADVLEHMVEPLEALKKVRPLLKPGGSVVASIPNVQFFGMVNHLAEGNWTYQDEGILDRTHLRFFTWNEIEKLFKEAGFEIGEIDETLDPQYEQYKNTETTTLKVGRVTISDLTPEELRRFFVFQYKFTALPIGDIKADAENDSQKKELGFSDKARELEAEGNFQDAFSLYGQWCDEEPKNPDAHAGMGNSYLRLGKLQEAIESYKKALEFDMDCIPALLGMGLCSSQKNEYMQAEILFQKVISLEPTNDRALCGLGMVSFQNHHYDTALNFFKKALDIEIDNKTAMSWLIQLAYETERFEEAEHAITRFLDNHPANLKMLFGLAGIYFQTGRYESARQLADKILLFEPGNDDALALIEKLQTAAVAQ